MADWPSPTLEMGRCNDVLKTSEKILAMIQERPVKIVVPLVEKVVLACAMVVDKTGLRGNSLETAIICTDRLSQRKALENTGLNPKWTIYSSIHDREYFSKKFPVVLKKPASARSEGVKIAYNQNNLTNLLKLNFNNIVTRQMNRLYQVGFKPDYDFIIEEFIEGENWEVDGISREKVAHIFRPLKQIWSKSGEKIVEYQALNPPLALINSAIKAIEACGIKWSGWCVELKGRANNWKVIEVNARLGEDDKSFYHLLSPETYPVEKLCQTLL